ncbi:hypothetical protein TWF481_008451 [Arthrobotrys musiformis]|uniref:F-box domain-containing protein n=1 Tax=Arthrobotrys musiformis TaxID=47236 RepID=A0AAV9W755_9PEZI
MTALSAAPAELWLAISEDLSIGDLWNLCLVSKSLYKRIETILFEKSFRRKKFYATAADSKLLLEFSNHPRGFNVYLKRLVIDLFVPYYGMEFPRDGYQSLQIHTQTANPKIRQGCSRETMAYKNQMLDHRSRKQNYYETLCAAISNFPNLEVIEFVETRASDMSLRSLKTHFPDLISSPEIFPIFREIFVGAEVRSNFNWCLVLGDAYAEVLKTLAEKPLPRLKEINICSDGPQSQYILAPKFFEGYLQDSQRFRDSFKGLQKLELRIQPAFQTSFDLVPLSESVPAAQDITRFLVNFMPQLSTLVYKSKEVQGFPPPHDEDTSTYEKYPLYPPNICLQDPKLCFENIKTLEFEFQSFVQSELAEFLIAHSQTLRNLTLKQCLFQTECQQWSRTFRLLESHLFLDSFFFDGIKQYRLHKCPPWLRIVGNIRSASYWCELVPGASENLDFGTAMYLIEDAEPRLEAARTDTEREDHPWKMVYKIWGQRGKEQIEPVGGNTDHWVFAFENNFRVLQAYIKNLYSIN